MLGAPELEAALQVGSHLSMAEGQIPLDPSAHAVGMPTLCWITVPHSSHSRESPTWWLCTCPCALSTPWGLTVCQMIRPVPGLSRGGCFAAGESCFRSTFKIWADVFCGACYTAQPMPLLRCNSFPGQGLSLPPQDTFQDPALHVLRFDILCHPRSSPSPVAQPVPSAHPRTRRIQ